MHSGIVKSERRVLASVMAVTQSPVEHPLGPPTLNVNQLTLDLALRQPTRITRRIADLTLQKFLLDRFFSSDGGVIGGAVVYDQATINELYLSRDVQQIAPGSAYPMVEDQRPAPKVAAVEKWGGTFYITDEAKDRNDVSLFNNRVTKLANTIVRKLNQRAVLEVESAIAALGRTFAGTNWAAAKALAPINAAPSALPAADLAHAQRLADVDELGVVYDGLAVNPQEAEAMHTIYKGDLAGVLSDHGINEMFSSNRVIAGTAYLYVKGGVGGMRVEQPLATETWREQDTDRSWIKSGVRPVMYVTDPFAIVKLTGLAG